MDQDSAISPGALDVESAAQLEKIFADLLWKETIPVRERTKLKCISWDSMMQLELLSSIEQEFNITLSDQDSHDLNSFDTACQIIAEKRGLN